LVNAVAVFGRTGVDCMAVVETSLWLCMSYRPMLP
jgi:hypothetical protein